MRPCVLFVGGALVLAVTLWSTGDAQERPSPQVTRLLELGPVGGTSFARASTGYVYFTTGDDIRGLDPRSGSVFRVDSGFAADIAVSPDGDRLAFSRGETTAHVWTIRLDPRTGRPLGFARRLSLTSGRGATFSPDGRFVAFSVLPATDTLAAPRIVRVPFAGGPEQVLVEEAGWAQTLRWSPDGQWIYYRHGIAAPGGGRVRTLRRVRANGMAAEVLAPIGDVIGLSPDGRLVAHTAPGPVHSITGERTVVIADARGKELRRFAIPGDLFYMSWGPGPLQLLGFRTRVTSGIHSVDLNGKITEVTPSTGFDRAPEFSPDGRHLRVRVAREPRYQLATVDLSSRERRVVSTIAEPGWPLRWGDATRIAFLARDGRSLHVVDERANREHRLAQCDQPLIWLGSTPSLQGIYACRSQTEYAIGAATLDGESVRLGSVPIAGDERPSLVGLAGERELLLGLGNRVVALRIPGGLERTLYTLPDGEVFGGQAGVSADGDWVAVVSGPADGASATSVQRLYLVPLRGGPARSVPLPGILPATVPSWDPAQRYITLVAESRARPDLWLVPLNGGQVFPLTSRAELPIRSYAVVAPDGNRISYEVERETLSLWTIDVSSLVSAVGGGHK